MSQFIKQLKKIYWIVLGKNSNKILIGIIRKQTIITAAYIWRRLLFNTTFIAVGGSVGKTTTKDFLATILEQKYRIMRTQGTHNHRKFKGLEMTILRTRPWHKFSVIEVGTEVPGDMESVAKFLKPDIVIMLDIKHCHTNVFKTLEALANEKSQLLKHLGDNGCVILNQDNLFIADMIVNSKAKVIRFGASETSELRLLSAESKWPKRLKLTIVADGVTHDVKTRLVGTHWASTIMASLVTARYCGILIVEGIDAICSIEPVWARMQPIFLPSSGATIIRDEWNGSIDTFETAFKVMDDAQAIRKIVVFSDYSDSKKNDHKRSSHIGRMAARCANLVIFVGNYAERSVRSAIMEGLDSEQAYGFSSISSATDFLRSELRKGDLVLIKGKTSHHLSRIYLGLIGSVQCYKESCSKQFLCDTCPDLGVKWNPELKGYLAPPDSYV